MNLVLVDTCIWVPFFNRPQSREKKAIDALLDDDRVALIGPIITEILQGFARESQAAYVASLLRGVRYLQVSWEDWRDSAQLGRRLISAKHRLPLSDLVLATVAMRVDAEVLTIDPHFDLITRLKRYSFD